MPAEQELGDMIVRLTGDGSEYQQMLHTADEATTTTAHHIEETASVIEGFEEKIKGFAESAVAALETLGSAEWLHKAFEEFSETETATIKLTAAMEANDHATKEQIENYEKFTDSIAENTNTTRNQVRGLLQLAETYGATGDKAEEAVKMANAFNAATGVGLHTGLLAATQIQQGNYQLAQRLLRLRGVRTESELHDKVQKILNSGLKIQEKELETSAGALKHLRNEAHEMFLALGGVVAKAVNPMIKGLNDLVHHFSELPKRTQAIIIGIPAFVAAFLGLGRTLRTVATIASFAMSVFSPMGTVFAVLFAGVGVGINKLGGFAKVWEAIQDVAGTAWDVIKDKAEQFFDWVQPKWNWFKGVVSQVWDGIIRVFSNWEPVKAAIGHLIERVAHLASVAANWAADFINHNAKAIFSITALASGITVAVAAFKAARTVIAALKGAIAAFHIEAIVVKTLMLAWSAINAVWTGSLLVAKGVIWLLNAALTANALIWAMVEAGETADVIALGLFTAATSIATAATAAFDAALGALPAIILAGAAAFGALTFAVMSLGGLFAGAWAAIGSLYDVIKEVPGAEIYDALIGKFKEWYDTIKLVLRVAQTDMPAAWELLSAQFMVTINEIKDAWPGVWEYAKKVALTAADTMSHIFYIKFDEAFERIRLTIGKKLSWSKAETDQINKNIENVILESKSNVETALASMKEDMADAAKAFNLPAAEAKKLQGEIAELEAEAKETPEGPIKQGIEMAIAQKKAELKAGFREASDATKVAKEHLAAATEKVKDAIGKGLVGDWAGNLFSGVQKAFEDPKRWAHQTVESIKDTFKKGAGTVSDIFSDFLPDSVKSGLEVVQSVLAPFTEGVSQALGIAGEGVDKAIDKFGQLPNAVKKGMEQARDAANNLKGILTGSVEASLFFYEQKFKADIAQLSGGGSKTPNLPPAEPVGGNQQRVGQEQNRLLGDLVNGVKTIIGKIPDGDKLGGVLRVAGLGG